MDAIATAEAIGVVAARAGVLRGRAIGWSVILPAEMVESDWEVVQAVLRGEIDRYAELVDKYQDQTTRLAFSMLGNYEDAKDASQEAFVSAYRSLGRFRGHAKFSTWLYRIVVNECKDVYKTRARRPQATISIGPSDPDTEEAGLFAEVEDPRANPGSELSARELGRALSAAIGRLPLKQRTAFVLHHLHGCPLDEVAAIMRCRVGTVKTHIFRAAERLRESLTPWAKEIGPSWTH
jgi:RNA polymerase sigma-70 factor (ECF subfamily)